MEEFPDRLEVYIQIADLLAPQIHLAVEPTHVALVGARVELHCNKTELGIRCGWVEPTLFGDINLPVRVDPEHAHG